MLYTTEQFELLPPQYITDHSRILRNIPQYNGTFRNILRNCLSNSGTFWALKILQFCYVFLNPHNSKSYEDKFIFLSVQLMVLLTYCKNLRSLSHWVQKIQRVQKSFCMGLEPVPPKQLLLPLLSSSIHYAIVTHTLQIFKGLFVKNFRNILQNKFQVRNIPQYITEQF